MRNLLTKILIKILKPDLRVLIRESLKGVELDAKDLAEMDEAEQKELLSSAVSLCNNKAFKWIISKVFRKQIDYTFFESATWEQAKFGRATAYGIGIVKEEAEKLKAIHVEANKPEEPYDKRKVI